jgi:kynurenine formamidase
VARWVADRGLCLTGADTWSVEVVPPADKSLAFPVHAELLAKHGIFNHENLVFDALLAERKYQFMYVFVPVPIKGRAPPVRPVVQLRSPSWRVVCPSNH